MKLSKAMEGKITVRLPDAIMDDVKAMVESGTYKDVSSACRAALELGIPLLVAALAEPLVVTHAVAEAFQEAMERFASSMMIKELSVMTKRPHK